MNTESYNIRMRLNNIFCESLSNDLSDNIAHKIIKKADHEIDLAVDTGVYDNFLFYVHRNFEDGKG